MPEFTQAYPAQSSDRSDWNKVSWHKTPLAPQDQKFLEFALAGGGDSKEGQAAQALLKQLAAQPDQYVACFYKTLDGRVTDVDFFLFSPSKHIFILVNHNT